MKSIKLTLSDFAKAVGISTEKVRDSLVDGDQNGLVQSRDSSPKSYEDWSRIMCTCDVLYGYSCGFHRANSSKLNEEDEEIAKRLRKTIQQ